MKLTFRLEKAKENGRSPIEIILKDKNKISKAMTENTDELLEKLDKLLKKSKLELESIKIINVEIANGAGLTSKRIVQAISSALRLNL